MKMLGLSFTAEEMEEARKNLEGSLFPVYNEEGKMIDLSEEPPLKALIEEIRYIQYKKSQAK